MRVYNSTYTQGIVLKIPILIEAIEGRRRNCGAGYIILR